MYSKLKNAIKNDTVLVVSWILALLSMLFVKPDLKYLEYIDVKSLALLFCLMVVVAAFKKLGLFDYLGKLLLKKCSNVFLLCLVLTFICFFSSMIITNDVALITFVPLAIIILNSFKYEKKYELLVSIITVQTVAANLGSMLTPIGNPQNIYLYYLSNISILEFINVMLPYTLVAAFLMIISCAIIAYNNSDMTKMLKSNCNNLDFGSSNNFSKKDILINLILFVICLATVARIIPFYYTLVIVIVVTFINDKDLFTKVDYSLLITFCGFFIFVGNIGRINEISVLLSSLIESKETVTAIVCSQFMSNVPATVFLSSFTSNYEALLIGVNLGGLGTLIASMASLISFKYLVKDANDFKTKYIIRFSVINIIYLGILLLLYFIIR